jgi:hypothetical protein
MEQIVVLVLLVVVVLLAKRVSSIEILGVMTLNFYSHKELENNKNDEQKLSLTSEQDSILPENKQQNVKTLNDLN